MKKIISLALAALMAMFVFAGCQSKENTAANDNNSANEQSNSVKQSVSGTVATNGSTSMEKVMASLIEAFKEKEPQVTVTYDATGSGAGITAAKEGSADIGLASRDLKSEETGLKTYVVAIDGIAIVVNKNNPVKNLTIEQIAALADGEITNWKDVGGEDAEVVLVGREAGSGTRDGFESIVGVKDKCVYDQELTSTGAVIASVASNPGAIGYASLSAVSDQVNTVKVNGIECTEDTVIDGTYEIQRNFNFVVNESGTLSEAAKAFIEFATSDEVSELIKNAGAVQPSK